MELFRTMGSEPLHLSFTSTGDGVALSIVTADAPPVAGWGETVEGAFANAYSVPEAEPQAKPASRAPFRVVAGTDVTRSPRT